VTKDEDITIDHIRRMSYLDAVIKESMRLQTPVPRIMRTITEEIKLGDYTIPKGVTAYVLISRLHYDPNVFPDPFEFRPERFLKENQSQSESAFSFTPFSAGARNCIGQRFAMNELRVVLAKVLLNFEIKSLEKRIEVKDFSAMISTPENGVHVTISPRS
jgi:cytochrome P450